MKIDLMPQIVYSLRGYSKSKLFPDILAGILVGVIALPLSIALSIACGAGPEAGLITVAFAGFTAALLGGSKYQITGPTGSFLVIIYGTIASFGYSGMLLATMLAGIFLALFGLFKLGRHIKYIPLSVVGGFTAGAAMTLFAVQLKDLFGLTISNLPSKTLPKIAVVLQNIGAANLNALIMGIICMAVILIINRLSKKLPAGLIAILICTLLNALIPSRTLGDTYGELSFRLSFSAAFIDSKLIGSLITPALSIALLVTMESLLSAVVTDGLAKTRHNPNAELFAQGMANILSAFLGGLPATGALARTSANYSGGAASPVSGMVHSLTVFTLGALLMPLASYIPMCVFAGFLIIVCKNMINFRYLKEIFKSGYAGIAVFILTFFLIMITDDLVIGIAGGTALYYCVALIKRMLIRQKIRRAEPTRY